MPIEAIKNCSNRFLFRSKAKPLRLLKKTGLEMGCFPYSFPLVLFRFDTELLILVMYVL